MRIRTTGPGIIWAHAPIFLVFAFLALGPLASGATAGKKFEVRRLDDKFSDTSKPYNVGGINNRVSKKSTTGGVHLDSKGVYINPVAFIDRHSDSVAALFLQFAHYNYEPKLGFMPFQSVIFLCDDTVRIELAIEAGDSDYDLGGWNTISLDYNSTFKETGVAMISECDLASLASSKSLEIKMIGGERSMIYNAKDIAKDFIPNIRSFCEQVRVACSH